jgi:hypothetical protein
MKKSTVFISGREILEKYYSSGGDEVPTLYTVCTDI